MLIAYFIVIIVYTYITYKNLRSQLDDGFDITVKDLTVNAIKVGLWPATVIISVIIMILDDDDNTQPLFKSKVDK
jgi:predicted membrane chloride channel (bestrophin family)